MNVLIRLVRRLARLAVVLAALAALALVGFALLKPKPQDLPWTPLDLGQQPGVMSRMKLVGLAGDPALCRSLLDRAGVAFDPLPPQGADQCRTPQRIRFDRRGALGTRYAPADVATSCPVAAALAVWQWHVVAPAAEAELGSRVVAVEHLGAYSCRRLYGRNDGPFSEHATANAIDIAAFRLADGRQVSIVGDWDGDPAERRFLRRVRDGACSLFATVLSPDYNAAHRDHFHLDQAARGRFGGVCR